MANTEPTSPVPLSPDPAGPPRRSRPRGRRGGAGRRRTGPGLRPGPASPTDLPAAQPAGEQVPQPASDLNAIAPQPEATAHEDAAETHDETPVMHASLADEIPGLPSEPSLLTYYKIMIY